MDSDQGGGSGSLSRLQSIVASTGFLVGAILLIVALVALILFFPEVIAGAVLVVFVIFAILVLIAIVASIVSMFIAVPVYLSKKEHVDDLDYDLDAVKEKE